MEALEVVVVGLVLEVAEDRHAVVAGQFAQGEKLLRIAVHAELLFADADRAALEETFDGRTGFGVVGDLVGEEAERLRPGLGEGFGVRVAADLRGKAVGLALVGGRRVQHAPGRKEDGHGHAHGLLVRDELPVGAARVVQVLVDVDDRFRLIGEDKRRGGDCGGSDEAEELPPGAIVLKPEGRRPNGE